MKLIKLDPTCFGVAFDKMFLIGNKEECVSYLVEDMHVIPSEIDMALEELEKNSHNVADFGINGRFIYSKDDPEYRGVA